MMMMKMMTTTTSKFRTMMNITLMMMMSMMISLHPIVVVHGQEEISLGMFSSLAHNLAGEVVIISTRVLEIRNFVYDGSAPAVYFWADTNAVPSNNGYRLYDATPTSGCGVVPLENAADGTQTYQVEFPENLSIFDILGGSISVWCEEFRANFGDVSVPTTLSNVPTTGNALLECSENVITDDDTNDDNNTTIVDNDDNTNSTTTEDDDMMGPYYLGSFQTRAHNVAGDVYLISNRVIEIRDFIYDGLGPATYFWVDINSEPSENGQRLYESIIDPTKNNLTTFTCGQRTLDEATGTSIYRVEFINGTTIQDYLSGSISVWCESAAVNFGEIVLNSTIPTYINDIDDTDDLSCATILQANNDTDADDTMGPYYLGSLQTRAHNVSGDVYLISNRIIEIRDFIYDGLGPATYFWVDTNSVPSDNGHRLYESITDTTNNNITTLSCGQQTLDAATGTSIYRIEFINGTTIQDYLSGSISVWCESAAANFGEIVLNSTLPAYFNDIDDTDDLVCITELQANEDDNNVEEISLGSFVSRAHGLAGDVVILSERVLEVRNFAHDGAAPAVYFWADTDAIPSTNGYRLLDAAPTNGCGMTPLDTAADGTVTYRVEFPDGTSIFDILGGSISVWCEEFSANFGEVIVPEQLDGIASTTDGPMLECSDVDVVLPDLVVTPTGFNCEPLSDTYQVRWFVEDDVTLFIELVGIIDEDEYMSFGISGSTTSTFMIGADIVVADTFNGDFRAQDYYMNDRSQCSGSDGVCPDTINGAVDDVNATFVSGDREQGVTLIRYKKSLISSDGAGIDQQFSVVPGESTFIVWAIGPVSPTTGYPQFHSLYPKTNVTIEFGRDTVDNCQPLIDGESVTTEPKPVGPFQTQLLQNVTDFVATIGPSGGDRGYSAITNLTSWGIAWYINDLLIPIIEMRRGTTYRFRVHGGNTPEANAEYHPFYITTSPLGGYSQLDGMERKLETTFAGIEDIVLDDSGLVMNYSAPLVAPICLFKATTDSFDVSLSGTYTEYFNTLDVSCLDNETITEAGAVFEFTPNETTPDVLYYQCVTHRNLGYKIMVLDVDEPPLAPMPISFPSQAPAFSPTSASFTYSTKFGFFVVLVASVFFFA